MKAKAKELEEEVQRQEMKMLQQKVEDQKQSYEMNHQKLMEKMEEERKQLKEEYERMTQSKLKVALLSQQWFVVIRQLGINKYADFQNRKAMDLEQVRILQVLFFFYFVTSSPLHVILIRLEYIYLNGVHFKVSGIL